MGLGFGLECGDVTPDDLVKARQMVPRALEQYVTQLAEKGPCASNGMPQVSSPRVLSLPQDNDVTPSGVAAATVGGGVFVKKQSDGEESESDVDVN